MISRLMILVCSVSELGSPLILALHRICTIITIGKIIFEHPKCLPMGQTSENLGLWHRRAGVFHEVSVRMYETSYEKLINTVFVVHTYVQLFAKDCSNMYDLSNVHKHFISVLLYSMDAP